jgi:hypothetical protein
MFCIPFVTDCGVELLQGPAGAGVDPIRGAVFWTPSEGDANTGARFSIATKPDACGKRATQSWTVAVSPAPEIVQFTAVETNIARGASATLTAIFSGTGRIDLLGPVTGVVPIITPPLNVTTTFTLLVTNPVGAEVRQSITIQVPSPPVISSFSASPMQIAQGSSAHLFWTQSGDFTTARLDPIGTDVRGVTGIVVTPATTTSYTLVLTDAVGVSATASVQVDVVPMPQIRSFRATPASTVFGGTVAFAAEFDGIGEIHELRTLTDGVPIKNVGAVVSGQAFTSPPLRRPTAFQLVVKDVFGRTATRDLDVELTGPGTFAASAANPLVPTRRRHSATRLADGRVFIAGGAGERSTEIYDPSTDTFVAGPQMQAGRQSHSAVLLQGGRVLLLGGSEVLFPATGKDEIFDPATGLITPTSWDSAGSNAERGFRLPDNRIFYGSSRGAFLIDPWALTRSALMSNSTPFAGCAEALALLPDGTVLAVLGTSAPSALFVSGVFVATGSPARNRGCGFKATAAGDGRVLLSGGAIFPGVPAEIYDPGTRSFSDVGLQRNFSTFGATTTLLDGRILLSGGNNALAEIYDPSTRSFSETSAMRVTRTEFPATLLQDGRVLVTGGCPTLPCPVEIYSP